MISVMQARSIILENILPLRETETRKISFCLKRISAVNIKSKENIPPFDNTAMDGFALRAVDVKGAKAERPKALEVIADLPAGYTSRKILKAGEAIRIMTGAPLPKGADSVVMVEDTHTVHSLQSTVSRGNCGPWSVERGLVSILKEVKKAENVRYAGEDVKKGEIVIPKGAILKSGHIGMLASLGISEIEVFRKPKVAIVATGDELVEINQKLTPGKIRNSNAYSLYSQVLLAGAIPVVLGIAKDNKKALERKIKKGLSADILLVSGGISVGDYDFVKDVLKEVGTEMKFWRVAMKPGKPLAFGLMPGTKSALGARHRIPVFGLPGNPVSSMISFEQFVRPALLKMSGAQDFLRFYLPAIAKDDFEKKKGLRYFLRVILENKDGKLYASLTGPQGSGILKSMVLANGIMELPEDMEFLKRGQAVKVTYLD